MSTKLPIEVPQEKLAAFCRKHRIREGVIPSPSLALRTGSAKDLRQRPLA